MKHGVAFRKFSRTPSHRMLMLRNMVTSLFEHEQIQTTLPKAKDAARLAEKMITLGKKGSKRSLTRASAFLLKPEVVPKLFQDLADRYAERPGGYTRIHKLGRRAADDIPSGQYGRAGKFRREKLHGKHHFDNAPMAVLELVDNPRDLRWAMTSRAIGRETLHHRLKREDPVAIINAGPGSVHEIVESERSIDSRQKTGVLRPRTRWNLQKLLRFRDSTAPLGMSNQAASYMDELLARPMALKTMQKEGISKPAVGQSPPGDTTSVGDQVRGTLGHRKPLTRRTFSMKQIYGNTFEHA